MTPTQVTERRPGKPHFALTGGRMPAPPSWAKSFKFVMRDGYSVSGGPLEDVPYIHWHQPGANEDIIAVRWLP